jgi:multicomponent K+:H+ antiporter subunit A
MPFTARLALVAAAAMAGVPLLNGFISKEMFFTEALTAFHSRFDRWCRSCPYAATLAGIFAVTYSLRFIHGAFFGPDTDDLPRTRTSRRNSCASRSRSWSSLHDRRHPAGATIGPLLDIAVRSLLGDATPEYSLAVWHGFNLPLLDEPRRAGRRRAALPALQRHLNAGIDGTPLLRGLDGRRIFDQAMVFLSWRFARRWSGCWAPRLQTQLRLLVCVASSRSAGRSTAWAAAGAGGADRHRSRLRADLAGGHRLRHRRGLPGQVPPARRAGPAGRRRAGHLPHLRLVLRARPRAHAAAGRGRDAVLLLLGLRWLPRRIEAVGAGELLARLRRCATS